MEGYHGGKEKVVVVIVVNERDRESQMEGVRVSGGEGASAGDVCVCRFVNGERVTGLEDGTGDEVNIMCVDNRGAWRNTYHTHGFTDPRAQTTTHDSPRQ